MADDISKNIIIQVTAQTDQLEQSITNLNKLIDNLLAQQKQLADAGKETSAAFQNNADKIDIFQKSLQNATSQLNSFVAVLNSSATALQKNQSLIAALTSAKDKYSKTVGDNSKKVTELNAAINSLSASAQKQQTQISQSQASLNASSKTMGNAAQQASKLQTGISAVSDALQQQGKAVDDSKTAFDGHKLVMDHLKTSFDEIKNVSGEFGPSLQDAAKGFNLMKSGLSVVKDGLLGVGDALKADGFDFLLQILQLIFNAFINSSDGSKILKGAISAIGVVVNEVKSFFNSFMSGLINAVSHPVESIKALGNMIEENIINRFKAFGVILDGIIHLDFKKIANGTIQAFTGVTNATDKIARAAKTIVTGIKQTGTEIAKAYKNGYGQANKAADASHKKMISHFKEQSKRAKNLKKDLADVNKEKSSTTQTNQPGTSVAFPAAHPNPEEAPDLGSNANVKVNPDTATTNSPEVKTAQTTAAAVVKIKKTALQQVEDYAKQSAGKIATNALTTLSNSIKQQADAKVAALEKDKNSELSNTSLTSAQKIAIQQKYKLQEDKVKAKAFKEEQDISIAQAIINGALAITKVTSQSGVLAPLEVGMVIAETAVQVAKIASQKPPAYAKGGLHYASDGKGGVLPGYSRIDNTNAYLRSGEGVVVSEAMRDPWARNLVSAINVGFGGRDFSTTTTGRGFAVGGIFTDGGDANRYYNQPVNDQKNLANSIAYQMVNNFPPVYVDVKDINNQQNILAQTINRVNL